MSRQAINGVLRLVEMIRREDASCPAMPDKIDISLPFLSCYLNPNRIAIYDHLEIFLYNVGRWARKDDPHGLQLR